MIPRECKRLAEVDFPIAVVSKHAVREKSIRHGHPSTLHLWWARRPLASCRAMLLALLLPDPCDPLCPERFKAQARQILHSMPGHVGNSDEGLREGLLRFIGDFANWDYAANTTFLAAGRDLVKAGYPDEAPLVVDPFAGGGSIPLEALRLGCEAFASDLNPVACQILRTLLEDIPRHGVGFADEVRNVGAGIKSAAARLLAAFYPHDPNGEAPIAYLWGRTVRCESFGCGAEIPIFKSPWLSKRSSKRARFFREDTEGDCTALVISSAPKGGPITLRVARGYGSPEIRPGYRELPVTKAKGNNSNVWCPCCETVLPGARVMVQLGAQNGGASTTAVHGRRTNGATLLAVLTSSSSGRQFRPPKMDDYRAVSAAQEAETDERSNRDASLVQINPIRPSPNARGLTAPTRYGATRYADLFTPRQRVAIRTFSGCIQEWQEQHLGSDRVVLALALALGRCIDQSSAHVRWLSGIQAIASSFPRQAVQMTWDFVESVPIGDESANFGAAVEWVAKVIERQGSVIKTPGQTIQVDAESLPLPADSCHILFTDPPYYDAVPYSDLANFFFVWLKPIAESLGYGLNEAGNNGLSPTDQECIWHSGQQINGHPKDKLFFETKIARVFNKCRNLIRDDGICSVVFAHKTTEGWEALISGLITAGLVIHSSWPIATERSSRTNAQGTASLATSIHLVCRPRADNAPIGDWADVLRDLPERVGEWMARLEREGLRGADLVFACIGPALEIFSQFSLVETPEGHPVPLAEYLEKVWEVVGRAALRQVLGTAEAQARNGSAGALEEDARLTALFLWTIRSTAGNGSDEAAAEGEEPVTEETDEEEEEEEEGGGRKAKGFTLIYDIARRFAQPLGIHLDAWKNRIIDIDKGVVRLRPVRDRARQLFGEAGAAGLADRIEHAPETARQLELFPGVPEPANQPHGRRRRFIAASAQATVTEATTLDRVHTAMLLQSSGRTNALRALLAAEQERGPDFVRLSNALSALYPQGSEEKRLLDAMLLALPR